MNWIMTEKKMNIIKKSLKCAVAVMAFSGGSGYANAVNFEVNLSKPENQQVASILDFGRITADIESRVSRVSKAAFDSCSLDDIQSSNLTIGEVGPNISVVLRFPPFQYQAGRTYYFIGQSDDNDTQQCASGMKFSVQIAAEPELTPPDFGEGSREVNVDLNDNPSSTRHAALLNDILRVGSDTSSKLVRVSKAAYDSCDLEEIQNNPSNIGNIVPTNERLSKILLSLRESLGYRTGQTYYFIAQDNAEDTQYCQAGMKFSVNIAESIDPRPSSIATKIISGFTQNCVAAHVDRVFPYTCDSFEDQIWKLVPVPQNPTAYIIQNSETNQCLVADNNSDNGVFVFGCNTSYTDQQFVFRKNNDRFNIVNKYTNSCLKAGNSITKTACNNEPEQQWVLTETTGLVTEQ